MLKWLRDKYLYGSPLISYGILSPCYRCHYLKNKEEPAIILNKDLKVKVIVNYKGSSYSVINRKCIGILKCNKCLDKIDNPKIDLPCKFHKI